MGTRTESDSFGPIEVDADHYWGAQTQRSLEHFAIGSETMPLPLIHALATIKKAAAAVNRDLGKLDAQIAPVGSALRNALNGLRSRGGGDSAESQLTALYQSTTGKGQFYGRHKLVKSGSDAGYRAGALKLAVLKKVKKEDCLFHIPAFTVFHMRLKNYTF